MSKRESVIATSSDLIRSTSLMLLSTATKLDT